MCSEGRDLMWMIVGATLDETESIELILYGVDASKIFSYFMQETSPAARLCAWQAGGVYAVDDHAADAEHVHDLVLNIQGPHAVNALHQASCGTSCTEL